MIMYLSNMENEYLRHLLSTIAYRFQKAVSMAETGFGNVSAGHGSRTPNEIINHMFHVLYATRIFMLEETYDKEPPKQLDFTSEIDRFMAELKNMDQVLARHHIDMNYTKRLVQGPFSDLLTHIGQIAMLSRLNGAPITGEDFSSASIPTGIA